MSNGDREKKHMVCQIMPHPTVPGRAVTTICATAAGQPAVFHDAGHAELLCAQFRTDNPDNTFTVLSFEVL